MVYCNNSKITCDPDGPRTVTQKRLAAIRGWDSTTRKQLITSTFYRTGVPSRSKTTSRRIPLPKIAIRNHLAMIAGMFSKGDFTIPMFIHSTTPPGVQIMQRLKDQSHTMPKTLGEVRSCELRLMIPRHVPPFTTSFGSDSRSSDSRPAYCAEVRR
jgi:hypothetical protein